MITDEQRMFHRWTSTEATKWSRVIVEDLKDDHRHTRVACVDLISLLDSFIYAKQKEPASAARLKKVRAIIKQFRENDDDGTSYKYSGIDTEVVPWSTEMIRVRKIVAEYDDAPFNLALVQLYRDGKDSIGWHSDDETDLIDSTIASVSMGAPRVFRFRRKDDHAKALNLTLSNELIVMRGTTQQYWEHCVPKSSASGQRLNITFRVVKTD